MSRLGPHQLAQGGAADGDGLVWNDTLGVWEPGATTGGIVESVVAGTNVTVDDTDPANPIVSATGGSGGTTNPLDVASPTDDFSSGLPAGWTLGGSYVTGDTAQAGDWLAITNGRAAGNYIYRACPAGDWTATMKAYAIYGAGITGMFGFLCVDNSGAGVGAGWYNGSPDATLIGLVAGGVYSAVSFASLAPRGSAFHDGQVGWYRLRKSGTNYFLSTSLNGVRYSSETSVLTSAVTMTRLGFGAFNGTPQGFGITWFDIH